MRRPWRITGTSPSRAEAGDRSARVDPWARASVILGVIATSFGAGTAFEANTGMLAGNTPAEPVETQACFPSDKLWPVQRPMLQTSISETTGDIKYLSNSADPCEYKSLEVHHIFSNIPEKNKACARYDLEFLHLKSCSLNTEGAHFPRKESVVFCWSEEDGSTTPEGLGIDPKGKLLNTNDP